MRESEDSKGESGLISKRTMEIVVSLLLLGASAIVIFDSHRIGFGWQPGVGPAPGYFPFYIAVAMAIASLVNLMRALSRRDADGGATFVARAAFWRVLAILVPAIAYVAAIHLFGFYVSSALFIALFMIIVGRESVAKSLAVGIAVPLALFFMFERWFLVPLPKGPLEAMLGLG